MTIAQGSAPPVVREAPRRSLDRAAFRVVMLSSLGGALEFYDFIIFGVFAAYISKAFFPAEDPIVSLLGTFAAFGVGYVARPIGGLVFGRRGDRHGRRESFLISLAVMSLATLAMGLMPTYATAGAWATAGFVALRLVQGFCLGGELPGAVTYAVEAVPVRRATLACGLVFGCVTSGVLLATGVSAALHALLTPEAMQAYGWRIGFLLGGALGVASWLLRRSLEESPAFLRMRQKAELAGTAGRSPLAELFQRHRARLLAGIAATCVVAAFNGLLFAHMPAYLIRTLSYPGAEVAAAMNVACAVLAVALVIATWVGDLVPRRYVYRLGCATIALGAIPAYQTLAGHAMPLVPLFALIGLSACFTHGTFAAILADLFPTEVRFSGVALAMNLGAVVFSGLGPVAATALIQATGRPEVPGYLLAGSALVALGASFWLKRLEGQIALDEGAAPQASLAPAPVGLVGT
jgi:MFS family permease